jgi:hypothetical protein
VSVALAMAGVVSGVIIMFAWRLPVIRRLFPAPPAKAVISGTELELHIPSIGVRTFAWDEIGSISPGPRGTGVLRSPAGRELVAIPPLLLNGNWHSLAQMIADVRGDRYAAMSARRFGPRRYLTLRGNQTGQPRAE